MSLTRGTIQIVKKFISEDNAKRADARRNPDLSDNDVLQFCVISGYIEALLARVDKSHRIYRSFQRFNASRFGKKVAHTAIKRNADAVIMFDSNAITCFEILAREAPHIKRILDCSIAARPYMYKMYDEEIANSGHNDLKLENAYLWSSNMRQKYQTEIEKTQYFLAGSEFVKHSLEECGVQEKTVYVVPYGANVESTIQRNQINIKRPIHFVFVGQVNYRKGITYILEAASTFDKTDADLTVVGAYNENSWFYKQYCKYDNIQFTGLVTKDKMQEIYEHADVFVIDSFAEGMAQVGIEAMACSLPVIASINSGLSDLVDDAVNGFIIPPGDVNILIEKMRYFVDNPGQIFLYSQSAKEKSRNFTWEEYESNAQSAICKILEYKD